MRALLLGGTSEARVLAALLHPLPWVEVRSSLAGRVARPRLPVGAVRTGGFGGIEGLRAALADYDVMVDATHPFALRMSANAVAACRLTATPLLRLLRPGWPPDPTWTYATDHDDAATRAATLGARPFLTVGRQQLAHYLPTLRTLPVLVRTVDRPELALPPTWTVMTSRGPYHLDDETALLERHSIDVVVTKDSGGGYTWPKLQAAAALGAAVVVVRRPPEPPDVPIVNDATEAVAWIEERR